MLACVSKKNRFTLLLCSLFLAISGTTAWGAVGQSAVITLVFPPGARATGLGEAFTGLSNDASAIYLTPPASDWTLWPIPGNLFWTGRGRFCPSPQNTETT